MKSYRFICNCSADTFRFELGAILGSYFDGCYFNGKVEEGSFNVRKNNFPGGRRLPRPDIVGRFYGEQGKTHVEIKLVYRTWYKLLIGFLSCILLIGSLVNAFTPGKDSLVNIIAPLIICGVMNLTVVIIARWHLRKLKKLLGVKMF